MCIIDCISTFHDFLKLIFKKIYFRSHNPWPKNQQQRNGDYFAHDPMTAIGFEDRHQSSN